MDRRCPILSCASRRGTSGLVHWTADAPADRPAALSRSLLTTHFNTRIIAMPYIDGFVIPVETANRNRYIEHAKCMDKFMLEKGAR